MTPLLEARPPDTISVAWSPFSDTAFTATPGKPSVLTMQKAVRYMHNKMCVFDEVCMCTLFTALRE